MMMISVFVYLISFRRLYDCSVFVLRVKLCEKKKPLFPYFTLTIKKMRYLKRSDNVCPETLQIVVVFC
jgi:hypothetical protein